MANGLRVKCPGCGEVYDVAGSCPCAKCGAPLYASQPAMLHLYRLGSPVGVAVGFGIYVDGQPCGFIANKETIHIPLPYGPHTIHVASGMNRKCNDITVELTPAAPVGYMKVRLKPGFWSNSFELTPANPAEMPNI